MICSPLLTKQFFPRQWRATGIHRLRNKWLSLLFQLVENYGDNSAELQLQLVGGDMGEK